MESADRTDNDGGTSNSCWKTSSFSVQTDPFKIDPILNSLFTILNYDTLKECRLVSKKWKEVCDSVFIKRSAFVLDCNRKTSLESYLKSPEDIPTIFNSVVNKKKLCFPSFKFKQKTLTLPVRQIYLAPNVLTMTELEIVGDAISETETSWNSNIDELIGPNLIKLRLISTNDICWPLSFTKIASIPHIDLKHCRILIPSNAKMAPKVLKLFRCYLEFGPGVDSLRRMNELIDFRSVETLFLFPRYPEARFPILNFSDVVNVKKLGLLWMTINLNAKISTEEIFFHHNTFQINGNEDPDFILNDYLNSTHIKSMRLIGRQFLKLDLGRVHTIESLDIQEHSVLVRGTDSKTNLKNLRLEHSNFEGHEIDLSLIPNTVEFLELYNIPYPEDSITISARSSKPIIFPNLKQLSIDKCLEDLPHFANCPNLNSVALRCPKNGRVTIDRDQWLQNIKILTLTVIDMLDIEVVGTKTLKLKVLAISVHHSLHLERAIPSIKLFLNQVQVEMVIFFMGTAVAFKSDDVQNIMNFKQEISVEKVAFGPVYWESEENFQSSSLCTLVDKRAEYYSFEGRRGKGILKNTFCEIMPSQFEEFTR